MHNTFCLSDHRVQFNESTTQKKAQIGQKKLFIGFELSQKLNKALN